MPELELFNYYLERLSYILNFQDRKLVEYWIEQLYSQLEYQYIESLFIAAIFELSITDTKTFHWTLDNLSDWKPCIKLLEDVMRFAVEKLMKKGFILGQDFSINSGKILLTESVKAVLMINTSQSDCLLLEKILSLSQNFCLLTT